MAHERKQWKNVAIFLGTFLTNDMILHYNFGLLVDMQYSPLNAEAICMFMQDPHKAYCLSFQKHQAYMITISFTFSHHILKNNNSICASCTELQIYFSPVPMQTTELSDGVVAAFNSWKICYTNINKEL